MKNLEREKARELRRKGYSLRTISSGLGCSKSSISLWIRDIPLTREQIRRLRTNQEKGRARAANHPNGPKAKWEAIRREVAKEAAYDIPRRCSREKLRLVGTALYWAEGYRASRNVVSFTNSDPKMVRLMIDFFKKVCKVASTKFRAGVHLHPHLNGKKAERFWSKVSGIPLSQFHRIQSAVSRASKQKRDTLPYGTFKIIICDTRLQSRIKAWIEGLSRWSLVGANSSAG